MISLCALWSQSLLTGDAFQFLLPQSFPFVFQIEQALIDTGTGDTEQSCKVCETQERILETEFPYSLPRLAPFMRIRHAASLSLDVFDCRCNRPFRKPSVIELLAEFS
jgi:hypothetical protein